MLLTQEPDVHFVVDFNDNVLELLAVANGFIKRELLWEQIMYVVQKSVKCQGEEPKGDTQL